MPKVQISESLFYELLGSSPSFQGLEQLLVCAKAEIDEPADADGQLKIELNDTNRPDLWSTAGLARQLKTYLGQRTVDIESQYPFFKEAPDSEKKIIVDPLLKDIRPYVVGFIVKGKKLNADMLAELIQMQEKFCENFGQKRQAVAIGIYRQDLIKWPIQYSAIKPQEKSFVPLDFSEELSLHDILTQHPKGKEYGHIIKDKEYFPVLQDSTGQVLSMPPVINSAFIGAVEEGDDCLFIECTGNNMAMLMLVASIMACDCTDMGYTVTRISTQYPYSTDMPNLAQDNAGDTGNDHEISAPCYFQDSTHVSIAEVHSLLGLTISNEEIRTALTKMGVEIKKHDATTLEIQAPPYRNDFLHGVDIIEDIMVGCDINSFPATFPKSFTVGRLTDIELLSRKVIQTMVGLGFQEMIFPYLGSRLDFIEKMYDKNEWDVVQAQMVQIANPLSENYEFVRASVLPNLLETERVSAHSPYPHRMCEIGQVAVQDATQNYGTRTDTVLGFFIADTQVGFTDINSIIAALLYYINVEWEVRELEDSRFIDKRAGSIIQKNSNEVVGVFGELHPKVLHAYNITMPCVAGELVINKIRTS